MQRLRVAVLISGGGTNLQAIIDAIQADGLPVEIACVISNRKDAFGLERAKKFGIEPYYIGKGNCASIDEQNNALIETLNCENVDLIVLAGYLAILPSEIIDLYENRIVNIHPALIPNYCGPGFYGMHVHEAVIDAQESFSGATVHFVDKGVDTGKIIIQKKVPISPGETAKTLSEKVLVVEHEILVKTLFDISNGLVSIGPNN